jgi:hypothetical protein
MTKEIRTERVVLTSLDERVTLLAASSARGVALPYGILTGRCLRSPRPPT